MAKWPDLTSTGNLHVQLQQRTGPTINRGKGNNNAVTPWKFINPVQEKFGPLSPDLAATKANKKAPWWVGPDIGRDSLTVPWATLAHDAPGNLCWLNPPFTNITPWAKKCAEECRLGARILLPVPASVGANWFEDWVWPYADVYSVGRMCFDDCYDKEGRLITTPYVKDLVLCHFDHSSDRCLPTGRQLIFWKEWQYA